MLTLDAQIKLFAVDSARLIEVARAHKQDGIQVEDSYRLIVEWIYEHGNDVELALEILKNVAKTVGWRSLLAAHLQRADEDYRLLTTGNTQQQALPPLKPKAPAKKQAAKKKASATPKKQSGSTKPS